MVVYIIMYLFRSEASLDNPLFLFPHTQLLGSLAEVPCSCSRRISFAGSSASDQTGKQTGCWIWGLGTGGSPMSWAHISERSMPQRCPAQWNGTSREKTISTCQCQADICYPLLCMLYAQYYLMYLCYSGYSWADSSSWADVQLLLLYLVGCWICQPSCDFMKQCTPSPVIGVSLLSDC